jgi:hypothetical protein
VHPITVAKPNIHIIEENWKFLEFCSASSITDAILPSFSSAGSAESDKHMANALPSEVNAPLSCCNLITG